MDSPDVLEEYLTIMIITGCLETLPSNQLNTDVKSRIIGVKKQMKTFEFLLI